MRTSLTGATRVLGLLCILVTTFTFAVIAQPSLVISPDTITFPASVMAGKTRTDILWLKNTGDQILNIYQVEALPDSSNPPKPPWLTVATFGPLDIAAGDSTLVFVYTYGDPDLAGLDICRPGRIRVVSSAPAPRDTLYCFVCLLVRSISSLTSSLDTLSTGCTDLVVSSTGNFGNGGAGNVNMDYFGPADCDIGLNSRGNSRVYLYDGSPIIIRRPSPGSYVASWSMYGDHRFVRAPGGKPDSAFSTSSYDAYTTGTLLTADSLVKVEITWYAPKHADTCNFINQKLLLFPAVSGSAVTSLQIGQAFDFDVPTDSGTTNVAGSDPTRRMVWQRGFNSSDTVTDCADNARRYGGAGLLRWYLKNKFYSDVLYGGAIAAADVYVEPTGGFIADSISRAMHVAGYTSESRVTDQFGLLTYQDGPNGFTLPANDTLFIYSAIATVNTAESINAGLDSLKMAMDRAKNFLKNGFWECCESPHRGNVNMMGIIDLADLSCLVSYLTGGGYHLPCYGDANVNGVGIVDLGDLSALVSYLTGGGFVLPLCP